MNSTNNITHLHQNVELHPNVKSALIHPQRSMEVRGWLKTHQDVAKYWRGDDGESMMHWAFLSDWVLASELREAGLSFQDTDRMSRAPLDWINDRLWSAIVQSSATSHQLSSGGKERLRLQSETQIIHLWNQGARSSGQPDVLHPGVVWMRSGAWSLLELLRQDNGHQGWLHWTEHGAHAIHLVVLSPNMPARRQFIKEWVAQGLDVDRTDDGGRSALWYAVDAWIASHEWRGPVETVISELIAQGADPTKIDNENVSPHMLIAHSEESPSEIERILELLRLPESSDDVDEESLDDASEDLLELLRPSPDDTKE